jgi:predicted negative regulator of RcsB-dependent stress response
MTKKITLPKTIQKLINKRNLIIAGSVLILLVLFSIAVVSEVRSDRQAKAYAASVAATQAKEETSYQTQIKDLKAANTSLQADKTALCTHLNSLSRARATRSLVIVPTAGHCQN